MQSLVWMAVGLLAGCETTAPKSPVAPAVASLGARDGAQSGSTAIPAGALEAPAARQRLEVVAAGATGMVVVNRRPVGLAPQTITVPVSPLGYLTEPVTIAVRFVARDVSEASMTVETVLETLDRAPLRIEFDRDQAHRVFGVLP